MAELVVPIGSVDSSLWCILSILIYHLSKSFRYSLPNRARPIMFYHTNLIGLFINTLDFTYFRCLPLDRLPHLRGFPLIAEIYAHQE
jgi:hypothetical protein